jgi:hypothetical protein
VRSPLSLLRCRFRYTFRMGASKEVAGAFEILT